MGWIPDPSVADDADAIHDNVAGEIAAVTEKTTPVSADLLLIEDSAASNAKKRIQIGNLPSSGSGSGSGWLDKVVAPASPGAQDDYFDDGSLSGSWTTVTISGAQTITEDADTMLLSVESTTAMASGDMNCLLQSHSIAVGDMIAVAVRLVGNTVNGQFAGLVLSDGTASTSNAIFFGFDNFQSGRILDRTGTLTNMASSAAQIGNIHTWRLPWIWVGLEHEASNSFRKWLSADGVSWSQLGTSNVSFTLTPTHIGLGWSTAGSGAIVASFAAFQRFTA